MAPGSVKVAELSVLLSGDTRALDRALQSAQSRLKAFDKQFSNLGSGRTAPNAGAGGGGGNGGASSAAATKSADAAARAAERQANAALRLAQAQAQGAFQAGNAAEAARILERALQNSGASALRQQGALNQLAAAQRRAAGESQSLTNQLNQLRQRGDGVIGALQNIGGAVTSGAGKIDALIGSVAGLGGAFAVVGAAAGALSLAQTAAAADAARASFDNLAASADTTGAALLASLQSAADGTVSNAQAIQSANTALLLLGSDVASELPRLLEVAKASAQTLGADVGTLFNNLVVGIARGSTELLDNLGISLSATEAYEKYAASIGKTAQELTKQERSQAILNEVLAQGNDIIARSGTSTDNQAAAFQRAGAAADNFKIALGGLIAEALQPAIGAFAEFAQEAADGVNILSQLPAQQAGVNAAILTGAANYAEFTARVTQATGEINKLSPAAAALAGPILNLTEAQFTYAKALLASGVSTQEAIARAQEYGVVIEQGIMGTMRRVEADGALAEAQQFLAIATGELVQESGALVLTEETLFAALSTAAGAAEERAAATEAAAEQSRLAAAAARDDAASELLVAANAEELARSKDALGAAAQLAAQKLLAAGDFGAATAARLAASSNPVDQLTAAYYRLAVAMQAVGAGTGAATRALQVGVRAGSSAADTTAALRSRIDSLRNFGGRPVGGGGRSAEGGGGGSAADSAQKAADKEQKIQQDLAQKILDIREKFYETSADIEADYQERILAIQEEYAERQLAAQKDLQVESAGSRADFYESLINSDVPAEVAQQLSAAYEQAFAEAQRLSQAGQAELAADYLALKEAQLKAEIDFQEKVAAARAKGDEEEIQKLEAIKRLRDAEFAARESRLKEEGDTNTARRDEQLTEAETARQERLRDAAVAAGDAQAEAQGRASRATETQNLNLAEQLRLMERIAATAGGTGQTTAPTTPTTNPNTPTPAATPPPTAEQSTAAVGAGVAEAAPAVGAAVGGALEPTLIGIGAALSALGARLGGVETAMNGLRDEVRRSNQRAPFTERP